MANQRTIQGDGYRQVYDLGEGQNFYFLAGQKIAVEKWEMRPGQTEFDVEVNSRSTRDGRPISIATTERALKDEFFERRVAGRQVVPFSIGNVMNVREGRMPDIAFTYGEAVPQVFTSREVQGGPVAWSIHFRRVWHNGPAGRRVTRPAAAKRPQVGAVATAQANAGASLQATASMTFLRIFIEEAARRHYRVLDGLGTQDVIGRDPTLLERLEGALGW